MADVLPCADGSTHSPNDANDANANAESQRFAKLKLKMLEMEKTEMEGIEPPTFRKQSERSTN